MAGGGSCVFSISYSVPHQPQHGLGMSSTIMAVDLCTHYETCSQLVEHVHSLWGYPNSGELGQLHVGAQRGSFLCSRTPALSRWDFR